MQNGLQRWLVGKTCPGSRSSSQVSLSEAGARPLGPQAMTGRVRRQGVGPRDQPDGLVLPRTVACGSVNGIEWTLSGRSAAGLALVFFSEQVHAGLCEWL